MAKSSLYQNVQGITLVLVLWSMMFPQALSAQRDSLATSADTTLNSLDEGFSGVAAENIDYEALVKELYGNPEPSNPEPEPVANDTRREPRAKLQGPAPGILRNSRINGSHLAISGASPFAVSPTLSSWYSYIDASATLKLPVEIDVEAIPLFLLLEVSSFSFENTYPEGGLFEGLAYIMQIASIGDNSGGIVGFGLWDGVLGSMLEINYRFRPTRNTFFRLGTRGVLITDIDPIGAAWWLELRLSLGLEI